VGATVMTGPAAAADHYLAAHRAFAGNGAKGAPAWLAALRARGLARFGELGFPTTHLEEWRFTSVAPILETPYVLAHAGARAPAEADLAAYLLPGAGRHRLVFVNGRFAPALSATAGLPAGVTFTSLADALARDPERVKAHLGASGADAVSAFSALNTAFLADGAYVHVAAGTAVAEPLQVLFLATDEAEPVVAHARTLIVAERLAQVVVVESYAGADGARYFTNAVTEVVAAEGARAEVYRIQRESLRAFHVAATHTRQGRDSVVHVHPVAFGAALARHDLTAVLDGENATCLLNGLYLAEGSQHLDHHTVIDHAQPHAESHEYFNGVLDGRSRGVFNGRIIVRPGAQRTDSKQTNNNLLLSEEARADSQPQLEIYADDVKCTHGATLGPIDEKALFYLKSRGLGANEARALVTYGFGAEILGRMAVPELRAQLDGIVRARLLGAGGSAG
jgi:Fe-S cluster assembly protein SufD